MPLLYIKLKVLDAFLNHNNPLPTDSFLTNNPIQEKQGSKNSMNIKKIYTVTHCKSRVKQDKRTHPT